MLLIRFAWWSTGYSTKFFFTCWVHIQKSRKRSCTEKKNANLCADFHTSRRPIVIVAVLPRVEKPSTVCGGIFALAEDM
jgi:hypothetical protein